MDAILHVVNGPVDVVEQWVGGHAAGRSHPFPLFVLALEGHDDLEADGPPVLSQVVVGGLLREYLECHPLDLPLGVEVGPAPLEGNPHGRGVIGDLQVVDDDEQVVLELTLAFPLAMGVVIFGMYASVDLRGMYL